MWQDRIVEAIHEVRDRYSEDFNHDLEAIFSDLRNQQNKSGSKVVSLSRPENLKTRWSGQTRNNVNRAMSATKTQMGR